MRLKILVFALLISNFCIAQNTIPKYELGLNLYRNELDYEGITSTNEVFQNYCNGIQFKRSLNEKIWMRFLFQYNQNIINHNSTGEMYDGPYYLFTMNYNNSIRNWDTKIGIEKVFTQSKIRPFIFTDLGYRYSNQNIVLTGVADSKYTFSSSYSNNIHYLNANLGMGVKYYPSIHIYLSLETSIGMNKDLFMGNDSRFSNVYNPINTFVFGVRF